MARIDFLDILYSKNKSVTEFNYDSLSAPSLFQWLNSYDESALYNIATSRKYSADPAKKKDEIKRIMTARGFYKIGGGTNRIVYAPYECKNLCVKIALDRVGLEADAKEYSNQFLLKPFVTKMFEISPSAVIGGYERVKAFTSIKEYMLVWEDVFNLISSIVGKYVVDDMGTDYFMNLGIRAGYGPVLLDFSRVFKLDGNKIYCNLLLPNGHLCNGEIDYDDGFNHLRCTKCGKTYLARELAEMEENGNLIISRKGDINMISVIRDAKGNVIARSATGTDAIPVVKEEPKKEVIYTPNGSLVSKPKFDKEEQPVVKSAIVDNGVPITKAAPVVEPVPEPISQQEIAAPAEIQAEKVPEEEDNSSKEEETKFQEKDTSVNTKVSAEDNQEADKVPVEEDDEEDKASQFGLTPVEEEDDDEQY